MIQPRTFDVVVVGAIGIDTNVYTQAESIDATIETHFTENLDHVGQSGGFSSRGFAQLGKKTAVIGYVGGDYSGAYIRQVFSSCHLMTRDMLDEQYHRLKDPRDVR